MSTMASEIFDPYLSQTPCLTWLPWIGEHSSGTSSLLLLGESFYEDGDGWLRRKEAIRNLVRNHGLQSDLLQFRKSKFFRNVEYTLLAKPQSSLEERKALWASVRYMNLVQRPMSSIKERPIPVDFDLGWQVVLDVAKIIRPAVCVRLGLAGIGRLGRLLATKKTGWKYDATDFSKRPIVINLQHEGYQLQIVCIKHPSGSFGYKPHEWAQVLYEAAPAVFAILRQSASAEDS
jgi:hypothetical protein